jgi:glycosyltransferase involved in cell wall biosynthesis
MRVAFPLISSAGWTGGYNYLLNLFRSTLKYGKGEIVPVLFCGEDANENDVQPFLEMIGAEVVQTSVFNSKNTFKSLARALLSGADPDIVTIFHQKNIDIVFENAIFFGKRFPLPVITWMPDFQHRLLRDNFSFLRYWRRELGFRTQVASCRTIMLSSEDARRSCEQFYLKSKGKTAVVRFSSPIPESLIEKNPQAVIAEYNLPESFFYLPNQFWRHKNHLVVIEALHLLSKQGSKIVVVATGNIKDPRHPKYFASLHQRIEQLGIQGNIKILGLIPRNHVISLMRVCTALINPSYFEGWSSTVEEARILNVPMLLSDIPVHREQMGNEATFFSPDNAEELANKMKILSANFLTIPENRVPGEKGEIHVKRFADDFIGVVKNAVGNPDKLGK